MASDRASTTPRPAQPTARAMEGTTNGTTNGTDEAARARRRFLNACGRFANATPPAVARMLAGHNERSRLPRVGNPNR